ncbi:unnamed protein product [Ambrosiozyma monospora]|uniref:Unnamed protein product n=1 Tax=Ambrosiozyma monospora TaxID=43982 RepID=A0A9W6SWS2_AMBMO|nr:unnamed protein product [Ambrosiozyma monospora]
MIQRIGFFSQPSPFWSDLKDAAKTLEPLAILITRSEASTWTLTDSFVQYIEAGSLHHIYLDGCFNELCTALNIGYDRYCSSSKAILATIFDISNYFNPSTAIVKPLLKRRING